MEFRKYIYEWLLLISGVFIAMISVISDIQSVEATNWFARSGSILVLVAAIVQYRLSLFLYEDVDTAARSSIKKRATTPKISDNPLVQGLVESHIIIKPQSTKSRSLLSLTSLSLVILGTIVWGYGDVLLS